VHGDHFLRRQFGEEVSWALPSCLPATAFLREEDAQAGEAPFYADSGLSAGKYLNELDERGWRWSVTYNKRTSKLDKLAEAMGEQEWSKAVETMGLGGQTIVEQHGWLRHLPGEECKRVQTFAVVRWLAKDGSDLFWRYGHMVGGGRQQKDLAHEPAMARMVFERHHLKGAKEQCFHQLLVDMACTIRNGVPKTRS